ncbi:MAG TPA: GNAT family N-acetyltransferase [Solirubrobacteraceae bacterium]|nr:GNAT family N-acetyltransferase [Solirubrobacteraceae bacterium]
MPIASIAWQTDVELCRQQGAQVSEHANHVLVRTAANPTYRWGNFLLVTSPCAPEDLERWLERFDAAFPDCRHVAIGLDTPALADATLAAFGARLEGETTAALVTDAPVPAPTSPPAETELRQLRSAADWQQAVQLRLDNDQNHEPGYGEFVEAHMRALRGACEHGHGTWFGAFRDGTMAAGLGIFAAGPAMARYESVDTHPAHRRQGLARALLATAAAHARAQLAADRLVILAEPDYFAIDLYRSMGFRDREKQVKFQRVATA